jgi:hypothetical protein
VNKRIIGFALMVVTAIVGESLLNRQVSNQSSVLYLPFASTLPLPPSLPIPIAFTSNEPIDVTAVANELREQGLILGTNKIGFHIGSGGNITGLYDMLATLDSYRIPFFLKSVDVAGTLYEAQQLKLASGVSHILVYRRSGEEYDVPRYDLPPEIAAVIHWNLHMAVFPSELDPSQVWLETINEVDKNRSEWLAEFSLVTAQLAIADGFNYAAFSWSSGEPEPYQWQGEKMLEFLRFAGNNPSRVAIALHEYSYIVDDIGDSYPYKVGRFQELFRICDVYGIPRPTVLITEWGWEYRDVPSPNRAMEDIAWANRLYNAYPQVKGAAIWYLGGGFGNIDVQTNRLIEPVTEYSLRNYFGVTPGQGKVDSSLFLPLP